MGGVRGGGPHRPQVAYDVLFNRLRAFRQAVLWGRWCCGCSGGVVLWLLLSLSLSPVAVAVVGVFFLERPVRILFGTFALLLGPLGVAFGG